MTLYNLTRHGKLSMVFTVDKDGSARQNFGKCPLDRTRLGFTHSEE